MYAKAQFQSTSSLPEFLIFPPVDESDFTDPCLCWYPESTIQGLANDQKDRKLSCVNATIQVFACLPEIHNELPLNHKSKTTNIFTKCLFGLHSNYQIPQINSGTEPEEFNILLKMLQETLTSTISEPINYKQFFEHFMLRIITKTRFGLRFRMQPQDYTFYIPIRVHELSRDANLIEILNSMYDLPSLFFGGPAPIKMKPLPLIESLPSFVVYLFDRMGADGLSDRKLEIPLEMDMGKFTTRNCKKPTSGHHYTGSPTFCRLHGFVTQKDGQYIVYTRKRSGRVWYRILDHQVEEVEMVLSIESKGILMAIYRLQDFE